MIGLFRKGVEEIAGGDRGDHFGGMGLIAMVAIALGLITKSVNFLPF